MLTANGTWVVVVAPPNHRKIREINSKCIQNMNLCKCYQHPFGRLLKQFSKLYYFWGPVMWPLLEGWYTRNSWFSRFFENISASFLYFFMKSHLVTRSYRELVINIKSLIMGALVTLETKSRSWPVFMGHFASCLFWHKPLA